ncbi:FixH family protein [Paenibacillus sp. SI8]|uniref:FixH family protein n=1 Tax=unclassified Paenibacillus TaxID=185978 RepID=UPI003464FA86
MRKLTLLKLLFTTALFLALLSIWLFDWSPSSAISAAPTATEVDGVVVEVLMANAPALILKPNPLKIGLHRTDGQPVTNAEVDFELIMPSMFCGKVSGQAMPAALEPGTYTAEAIPLMAGVWSANITIKLEGSVIRVEHPFDAIR